MTQTPRLALWLDFINHVPSCMTSYLCSRHSDRLVVSLSKETSGMTFCHCFSSSVVFSAQQPALCFLLHVGTHLSRACEWSLVMCVQVWQSGCVCISCNQPSRNLQKSAVPRMATWGRFPKQVNPQSPNVQMADSTAETSQVWSSEGQTLTVNFVTQHWMSS